MDSRLFAYAKTVAEMKMQNGSDAERRAETICRKLRQCNLWCR
jgi:hypothetical protein